MAKILFRELLEEEKFDLLAFSAGALFTQSEIYGNWQKATGKKVRRFVVEVDGVVAVFLQTIKYPLFGRYSYLYCPYGPVYSELDTEMLDTLKLSLSKIIREEDAVFARLDFTPALSEQDKKEVERFFKKACRSSYHSAYFQPRNEWILPLDKSEEELLGNMHKNTRYSIRKAEQAGVEVRIIENNLLDFFDKFYSLMKETSERNKFGINERKYYEIAFKEAEKNKVGFLSVAYIDGKESVIDFCLVYGGVANYVFSGSNSESRSSMPSYLSKWEAIKHAKKIGCKEFNFGGVSVAEEKDLQGVTLFKERFGGSLLSHSQFYDLVGSPVLYFLYNLRKIIKNF